MYVKSVTEAKTQLSALIERVLKGEEVIIARAGKPVAVLRSYDGPRKPRCPGRFKGQIEIAPDFDELPTEVAEAFGMESR
ncbi:MAG: type II toxin-antitoxin system prevent-host-death family antitoxin [Deltaproteobacteria bacterium]|nr:type II toxin-antitoxin system prevent-host-death family antitoxin [Deltaproteobacteria bacterium]